MHYFHEFESLPYFPLFHLQVICTSFLLAKGFFLPVPLFHIFSIHVLFCLDYFSQIGKLLHSAKGNSLFLIYNVIL